MAALSPIFNVEAGITKTFNLPSAADAESDVILQATVTDIGTGNPATFVSVDSTNTVLSVGPVSSFEAGTYSLKLTLKDSWNSARFYFFDVVVSSASPLLSVRTVNKGPPIFT
jgi:hypothetical protein